MSWELPALITLCIAVFSVWWFLNRRSGNPSRPLRAYVGLTGLAFLVYSRRTVLHLCQSAHHVVVNATVVEQFNMALTFGAVVWLLYRSWQTLWKPVPELVNILGVDIPVAPDVCLAGISADSATLTWTRPASNRPVQKYLIQVNGVHVGDSPGNETAITVTGLRPSHFYNLRVVAVGPNNFRAGSPLIRLETFGKDARPQLGNSRLPTSFVDPNHPPGESGDDSDDSDEPELSLPTVETVAVLENNATMARDSGVAVPGQRRNTVNRRHSPSVASSDQPPMRSPACTEPGMSLAELNNKFEGIRREIDDTLALYAKDEAEFQQQEEELTRERDRKRLLLKEKEEQTAQLKAMVRTTMEQMRAAEKERAKKEQLLKDKETKKAKVRDSIAKFENEVERMKTERLAFESQKQTLNEARDRDVRKLGEDIAELHESCAKLEAELKDKGKQLQDAKAAREQLPGADDERWKEEDIRLRREWELRRREMHGRLVAETKEGHAMDQQIRDLTEQLRIQQQRSGLAFYNQPSSSNMDFHPSPTMQANRVSHTSTSLANTNIPSPDRLPPAEPNTQGMAGFNNAAFARGLFMDMTADGTHEPQTEADFKTVNGPLSPSAQTLLPSNIFEESEEVDTMEPASSFGTEALATGEEGPQSPASSSMSFNVFSSPHGSAQNLPFPQYMDNSDRNSLHMNSPPTGPLATGHKIASFLSTFQRGRGAKTSDESGPPIGSLKSRQSQSFPTVTDEQEVPASRRRLNLSAWMSRNSIGPDSVPSGTPAATSRPRSALRLNPFRGSPAVIISDGDGEFSRPASIASTDLARPSTDSGSIWGTPGDVMGLGMNRLWSPSDGRWPSRSVSRRPSLQGSNTLTTTLASADDEILDEDDLLNPETLPSQVGVIGTRPPGSSKLISQRLNPAAPTFMGHIFRKDRDKDKDKAKEEKGKGKEAAAPGFELPPSLDDSPSDSRASRDTYSVHTQTSVSESRESLQLDGSASNTASDLNSASASNVKDPENVVRKLFRKGSTSKFSLSSRLGKDSGLFKKGPGSTSNSDKNMSAEHGSSIGDQDEIGEDAAVLGRSFDSMASSPSLGPLKSREGREGGRMSSWRFSMSSIKKKGKDTLAKEKEGLEMDRAPDED